jgi:hypothetical protein
VHTSLEPSLAYILHRKFGVAFHKYSLLRSITRAGMDYRLCCEPVVSISNHETELAVRIQHSGVLARLSGSKLH